MSKTSSEMAALRAENRFSKSALQSAAAQHRQLTDRYGDNYQERAGGDWAREIRSDAGPTTLSEEDFERFVKMSGATVMYRGWRGKEDYDRFLQSKTEKEVVSASNQGYIVAKDVGTARSLPGSGNTVTKMILNPNARVISYERVSRAAKNAGSRLSNAQMALKMGYNVIRMGDGKYVGLTSDAFIISKKTIKY